MYNISLKYKRTLFLAFKILIVLAAFYFIYNKLTTNHLLSFSLFRDQLHILFRNNIWILLGVLLLTDGNWIFEILKWKTLVSTQKKISFLEAIEQSLAALTISLFTPNRIGEYGAKALLFEKPLRKKIVLLNLVGNLSQLLATILFGIIGMTFFLSVETKSLVDFNFNQPLLIVSICVILLLVSVYFRFPFFETYWEKIKKNLKKISKKVYLKIIVFSIIRYLFFSHQFFFLLVLFGVEIDYSSAMYAIFTMYFLASFIPSFPMFEWAIKGSVAIWVFNFTQISDLTVVSITTLMWVLNFGIPAVFGSIFVLNFKTDTIQ